MCYFYENSIKSVFLRCSTKVLLPQMNLHLSQDSLSFSEIQNTGTPKHLADYELSALLFCKQWLSDTNVFTVHTSGSTGQPQAWQISREAMRTSAKMTATFLGLQREQKALVCLNTAYIAGIMMLVRCMEVGMEAYIVAPSANPLLSVAPDFSFDFAAFVPMQMSNILENQHTRAIILRTQSVIIGGAAIESSLEKQLEAIDKPLFYSTYGMTETVSHIALRALNGTLASEKYWALPQVQLSTDTRQCLCINAPTTEFKTLITNDIVDLSEDKQSFVWLGRADNVINSGGVKIQAEKVEKALEKALAATNSSYRYFVAPLPHPLLGEAVVAFIEAENITENQQDTWKNFLRNELSPYEIPKQFVAVPEFAQTPTQKINRKETVRRWREANEA
jgi:O-succinylbenzoic acid--CoA ligase